MSIAFKKFMPVIGICVKKNFQRSICSLEMAKLSRRSIVTESIKNHKEETSVKEIIDSVNKIIDSKNIGQTFAVVHFYGKEFLVHLGDIICIQKAIPVEIGEKIKLEKCLLIGNSEFSLIGRPVLNRDLVQIEATVTEKTMSQTFFNMHHVPRDHGNRRYRFQRNPQTMLRINEIQVCHSLNVTQKHIN